jgi:E3 ubiquitin-protein ligase RGLG
LESSQLIIGVDFTKSNEWNGKVSNGGKCLHDLVQNGLNPYQKVIDIIGRTLEPFDADKQIPVFGFGDISSTDKGVFPFNPDGKPW